MKRRDFLKRTGVITAAAAAGLPQAAGRAAEAGGSREYYDLRMYHLRRGPKQKLFDDAYGRPLVAALNRAGLGPIGAFNVTIGPDNPTVYMVIPHPSIEVWAGAMEKVRADAEFQRAAGEFLNCPPTDPAYVRVESQLLRAFGGIPRIEVPELGKEKKPRIFELRTYEAHSKKANLKKIEMFDRGEIEIFRKTGLQPVFFGETLFGPKQPSLTYLLAFENMAARDRNWATFAAHPDWKKLSSTPGFTDPEILTNISSVFLRPTDYSQV